jgi:hypothetical protein
MKLLSIGIFLLTFSSGFSQSIIDWRPGYQLKLSEFQSPQTEINEAFTSSTIFSGSKMEFGFQMSGGAFMFTKNFNSKAKTTFNRNAAVITAPDSATAEQLVAFAQYNFDLTELFTRKFRKEMYEKKGSFSDFNFFQPIFNELQEELNAESARVSKATDLGRNAVVLAQEHKRVLSEIESLSDFCFECKPPKKQKKGG